MRAAEGYRSEVSKALHSDDVWTRVLTGEFVNISALLPIYILKTGKAGLTAVVNGQTGRVAVTSLKKPKTSKLWLIEPAILTVISILVAGWVFDFNPYGMFVFGGIAGLLFFIGYGDGKNAILNRIILRGKSSRARRENGKLILKEGKDALKNPFSDEPVFYEEHENAEVPVKIKFYTLPRVLMLLLQMLVLIFLPLLVAMVIHTGLLLFRASETSFVGLHPEYGAAWYALSGGIAILYWIKGIRNDVFNHPILYELLQDGSQHLIGTRKSRQISLLSIFRINGDEKVKWCSIEKGTWLVLIGITVIFIGSTAAILL